MFKQLQFASALQHNTVSSQQSHNNLQGQFTPGFKVSINRFETALNKAENALSMHQGKVVKTGNPTHLAVSGKGFFAIRSGNTTLYTRDGRFKWDQGNLQDVSGRALLGVKLDGAGQPSGKPSPIEINGEPGSRFDIGQYASFKFDESGNLFGEREVVEPTSGRRFTKSIALFRVSLATFENDSLLKRAEANAFQASEVSGEAYYGQAGEGAIGQIIPESLELSNVDYQKESAAIGMKRQLFNGNLAAFKQMNSLTQSGIGALTSRIMAP